MNFKNLERNYMNNYVRLKDELYLLRREQPNKELVESLLDSTVQMAKEIAEKEGEIAIRLYLLQSVIENITLRQAFIKYKVQTATSRNIPTDCTNQFIEDKEKKEK